MSSPQWSILAAVKAELEIISAFASVSVVIRKRLFYSRDHDTSLPMVIVSPQKEELLEFDQAGGFIMDWPIIVAILQEKSGIVQSSTSFQWQIDRRWDIQQRLQPPTLSGAATVFSCVYDPEPILDISGMNDHYHVSLQKFTYRSSEEIA